MKYFTPELYTRLQDSDTAAMDAADAGWEAAEERYEQHLQRLAPALTPVLRVFDGLLLHDATVSSMSRGGDQLVIVMCTDARPREVVTLTYTLTGEPLLDREALPPEIRSGVMQYQYDEFDLTQAESGTEYLHAILFSNGWELRLRFRHVEVVRAEPLYLLPARADRDRVACIEAHLRRIQTRCVEIIADEVQNCLSLSAVYKKEIGDIHPGPAREVHVQSVLFAGLRASGYFTLAGAIYEMPDNNRRQVDLAGWLPDVHQWYYLEVKPCEQQGGISAVRADAQKLLNDNPPNPKDRLRGVLAYGFKYGTSTQDRYPVKFEKISEEWKPMGFIPVGIGRRDLYDARYPYAQVGIWVIGLDDNRSFNGGEAQPGEVLR